MKKQLTTVLIAFIPAISFAQPTLNKILDHAAGTSVKFQNCDAVTPGVAGANKTWDFTNIDPILDDTIRHTYIAAPAGNPYGANLVQKTSDSMYIYLNRTAGKSSITAILDSSAGSDNIAISYANNSMLLMQRPATYGMAVKDTFVDNYSVLGVQIKGGGTITLTGDGYGTLKLPAGTFNNVLRLRTEQIQVDTFPPPVSTTITTKIVSYQWFDNDHKAPLLRIDSTTNSGFTDVSVAYLVKEHYPTNVADAASSKENYTAAFINSALQLRGDFKTGAVYDVALYNIAGQVILINTVTATGNVQKVAIETDLQPGMYMVKLTERSAAAYTTVIKLMK